MSALQVAMFRTDGARIAPGSTETTTTSAGSSRRTLAMGGSAKCLGTSEEGRPAPTLLDSPLPDGRFHHVAEGGAKVLISIIESLRSRNYRRVAGAPSRVGEFSAECLDAASHKYRLEWIEPRPARAPKARRSEEAS